MELILTPFKNKGEKSHLSELSKAEPNTSIMIFFNKFIFETLGFEFLRIKLTICYQAAVAPHGIKSMWRGAVACR
ncbi:unnamed protein product [Thelazia callipaeda]|uniref:Uncharacterized protein n=1 Tax=Thelazia callipaeda TaxID=103827 RepID=A0A0N5CSP1_THECL|nr:unnamed protein product [Thelazia callipaeda]